MPDALSNTSPLQYLHQLGRLEILPALWGNILVPLAVAKEIEQGHRLGIALPDLQKLSWLRVTPAALIPEEIERFDTLGPGERAVLAFARSHSGAIAILDDAEARRCAARMGIQVVGTLGLLKRARQQKILSALAPEMDRLQQLGFRFAPHLRQSLLREVNEG